MRKSPIVDALFPGVRGSLLAAMLLRSQKEWYLSELAKYLDVRPSSLQREIKALSQAGILAQRKDGRRAYLKLDPRSPVLLDLKSIFEKTAGTVLVLHEAIAALESRIRLAFLYGSMARSSEDSESDVDLLVIGEAGLSELVPHLRQAERLLGRQVSPIVFSVEEFSRKVSGHDHFLSAVLQTKRLFLKGDELELAAITREG